MSKVRRGIQSIEVGGRLLTALVDAGRPLPLRELAEGADMTSAKAHPYLVSYGKLGLIEQELATGRYALGPFALQLGMSGLQQLDPLRAAIPVVAELAAAIGHTVAIAVLGTHGPTIVHLQEGTSPIHINMRMGTVMSLTQTATGRVFAALLPRARAAQLIARQRGDRDVTGQATADAKPRLLTAQLTEVREREMARALDSPIPGVHALSAPVRDATGALVLAITAVGPAGVFDSSWDGAVARPLRDCVHRVSIRLGYADS